MTSLLSRPSIANYAWIIDKDLVDDDDPEVGTTGPSTAPQALLERLAAGEGRRFRMLDGDDELYYEGRLLVADEDKEEDDAFGPLTDFGMPNASCTEIQYKEGNTWKGL